MTIATMALDPLKGKAESKQAQTIHPIDKTDRLVEVIHAWESDYGNRYLFGEPKIPVLNPNQIEFVLDDIIEHRKYDTKGFFNIGRFISRLMQQSYDEGFNHFKLGTTKISIWLEDMSLPYLCTNLGGSKKRPIYVEVYARAGDYFGNDCSHLDANVERSGNALGQRTYKCNFRVELLKNFSANNIEGCKFYTSQESTFEMLSTKLTSEYGRIGNYWQGNKVILVQ